MGQNMKIAIIEDHPFTRAGTKAFLEKQRFEVKEYSCASELFDERDLLEFSAFIIDLNLPDSSGIEVTKQLRESGVIAKIIIFTAWDKLGYKQQALQNGANGFIYKGSDAASFLRQMLDILWQNDSIKRQLSLESVQEESIVLTKQQQKIVCLLYDSYTLKQIAEELQLSKRTVEYHLQNLKNIFQVSSIDALKSKIYKEYF